MESGILQQLSGELAEDLRPTRRVQLFSTIGKIVSIQILGRARKNSCIV